MERRRNTKRFISALSGAACKGAVRRLLSLVLVIAMLLPWTLTAQAAENPPEDMAGVPAPQAESVTVGDFTVTGGSLGTDYTFDNNTTLVIRTDTPITIANTDPNTATSNHIDVIKDVSANITLAGLNIDVSGNSGIAALYITNDSSGNVTITLAENTTNTLKSGANCAGLQKNGTNGTLTITGTGTLNATGGTRGAGIGGGYRGNASHITINSGDITAIGGSDAAGIGGGNRLSAAEEGIGNDITINGGKVSAHGNSDGAGIGGGGCSEGTNITISGGTVTATSDSDAIGDGNGDGAGIGGGDMDNGSGITISGGTVTAISRNGAGIGGGKYRNGYQITISGGTVEATSSSGAGIGGGKDGSGSSFNTGTEGTSGNGFIDASSISDTSGKDSWSGVIIEGNEGQVYGNPTLNTGAAIPEGKTVTVPAGNILTVGADTTLTNNGTLKIAEGGSVTGNITGNPPTVTTVTEDMLQVPEDLRYNGLDRTEDIKNTTKLMLGDQEVTAEGWTLSVTKVSELDYTVTYAKDGTDTKVSKDVTLMKAQTVLTAEVTNPKDTYEYKDTITITGTISPNPGVIDRYSMEAYSENGYVDNGDATLDASTGVYTLTLDNKELVEGENTITVKYSGCDFMAAAETTLTITMNPCTQHQFNRDGKCDWCGQRAEARVEANGETAWYATMAGAWDAACKASVDGGGAPVTIGGFGGATVNETLILSNGANIILDEYGSTLYGGDSLTGPVVKVTNGQLTLESNATIANGGGSGVEVSGTGTFILNGGKVAAGDTSVLISGGSFTMNGGTLGKADGICALEIRSETAAVTICAGDPRQDCALEGATAVHLTADAAVTITSGTFSGTTSGLKADVPLTKTKLSGGTFSSVEVTGGTAASLLETGLAYYKDGTKVENAAVDVLAGPVSVAKASDHSTGDLNLHDVTTNQGDLETDGYSWEYSVDGSVLTLKDCTVVGSIILPNKIPVTVKVEGASYVGGNIKIENIIGTYTDGCNITFAGSELLYVAGRIGWDSGSNNKITISAGANVTAAGGLGIPSSGSGGILTVDGTLNAVGDLISAISAGKVILNDNGSLNVSGAKGVSLVGMSSTYDVGIANAFEMNGGTFTSTCTDYSVRVTGYPSAITEANAQSAFHFPADNYIPAGYSVQYASDGEYNAVVAIAPDNTPDAVLLSGTGMGGYIVLMPHYTITVDAGITNGTVTVSPTKAAAGQTITLTLTPADGYYGGVPTVTAGGNSIVVSQAEGVYTFTMPASDVTVTASFVKQTSITDDSVSVTLASGTYTYTGSEHKPSVTVMKGSTPLTEGTDYTVTYSDNTNAGEATVTVTGKGAYTGIKTETFHIDKATLTITGATLETREYEPNNVNATVTDVTFDGIQNSESLTLGTDYTATAKFTDANAGEGKTATVTVTLPDTSNYAFAGGAKTVSYDLTGQTIRPKAITVTLAVSPESMEYTGGERKPSVEVSYNGTPLDTSLYEVSYSNHILPGTGTVTVTGTENYAFTATKEFTITCPHPGMKDDGHCTVCGETIAATVKVGEATTYYTDITSAWNDAQGKTATITMLIDQTISSVLEMDSGNLTLTMKDGVKLNQSGTAILIDGGTLTLENCHIVVTGEGHGLYISGGVVDITNCIITKSYTGSAILVDGGTVNVYSGTFTGAYTRSITAGLYVSSGDAHLYGGTYVSNFPQGGCSIYDESGNIGRFLAEGYAYKQSGAWLTGDNVQELRGAVQVLPIPAKITAQPTSPAAVEYGYTNAPTLTVTAEMPEGVSGEVSYTWHEVGAAESRLRGSSSDTYTVPMGLSAGTYQYYCEVECDGYTLKSNTVTVTVNQKTLTPTITGTTEKVYDGTTDVLNDCSIKLEGVEKDDDVRATVTSYAYDSANAGDRTITATGIQLSGTASGNYKLSVTEITTDGTITKKAPTITFADQSITYGGTPTNATVDSKGAISYSYVVKDSTMEAVNGWPENAGTYLVTAWAAETANYKSGSATIILTIDKNAVTDPVITLSQDSYVYDGTAKEPTVTVKDVDPSEYQVRYENNVNAGEATVTVTANGNYSFTASVTFRIEPASISTATVAVTGSYTYNGNAQTPVVTVTLNGKELKEGVDYTMTSVTDNVNAGTASVTVTGKDNYTDTANTTFEIAQAPLTVAANPQTVTYGESIATDTEQVTVAGLVNGDILAGITLTPSTENVPGGEITVKDAVIKTADGTTEVTGNYAITYTVGKLTILKAEPTLTFENQTITYGDTPTEAAVDSKGTITYSYVIKDSTMEAVNGWPTNAGTYLVTASVAETANYKSGSATITLTIDRKPIQVPEAVAGLIYNSQTQTGVKDGTGYTLTGNTAKNAGDHQATAKVDENHIWQLADSTSDENQTIAWSIAKKDITVEITANSGTYNGNPYPAEAKLVGLEDKDDIPVTLTYTDGTTNAPTDAGDYTVTASIPEGNYNLTDTVTKDFTIEKADPALTVSTPVNKTYGDADFNLNATQTGNGTLTYTSADETVATVDETGKVHMIGAGSTTITVTAAETDNYTAETKTVTVTVEKAAASLTAENIPEKTYGDEAFAIVYQRTGESDVAFTSSDPSVVTVDESGKVTIVGAGSAVIKLSMEETGNYLAASTEVSVVVNPKTLTLTIIPNGGVLGQPITGAEAKLEGLVDGDQADVTLTYTKEGETTGSTAVPTEAGTYTVTATINDPNYIPTEVVIAQFVVRQPITITVKDVSKTYGEQDPELSYEVTEGTVLDGKPLNIQLQRTDGENVGSYGITALDAAKNNPCYEITVVEGSLNIQARDIRDAKVVLGTELTANGQMQTQTVTGVTVVNSQGEILDVTYTVTGNMATNAGEYTMTITGTGNFTGTKEQTFTVHVKPTEPTDATQETKPESGTNPGTGDTRWMGLWGMMMLLSAAGVAVLLEKRKKTV